MRDRQPGSVRETTRFEMARSWTDRLVSRGQALGVVRTDLSNELLVELCLAVSEAGDRWMVERFENLSDDQFEADAEAFVDVYKRILEPRGGPR